MTTTLNDNLNVVLKKTEDKEPTIGKQYHIYFNEGNINNKVIEIREKVDDIFVYRYLNYNLNCWVYDIMDDTFWLVFKDHIMESVQS